jgi:2-polyprenyl-3-methyl-5-hydroxy-6-metoxy-1,4-benzoquinol methylase
MLPSERRIAKLEYERRILAGLVDEYQEYFKKALNGANSRCLRRKNGCYKFVPTRIGSLVPAFIAVDKYICKKNHMLSEHIHFLDAGCGMGNIMLLARELDWHASGVEIDPKCAEIARAITKQGPWIYGRAPAHVHVGDLLKYTQYHKYDVIYYWEPIYDRKLMLEFTNRLADQMKPGAVVIPRGPRRRFHENKGEFKRLKICDWDDVYEKGGK